MKKYSCLIVGEDLFVKGESIACVSSLKACIDKYCPRLNVVGEISNQNEVLEAVESIYPEAMFLRINLKHDSTFKLLEDLSRFACRIVIICSNHKQLFKVVKYANIADCIIEPINLEDLMLSAFNVVNSLKSTFLFKREKQMKPSRSSIISIMPPHTTEIEFIKIKEIIYCEADGRNTLFHLVGGGLKKANNNLREFEILLEHNFFFRIHYKYLINLEMVEKINKSKGYTCVLVNGKSLLVSKRRQDALNKFIKIY